MSNPINIYNSKIGIHNPYFDSTNYVYQLDIFFKNNSKKTFNKITNKKYTRLSIARLIIRFALQGSLMRVYLI